MPRPSGELTLLRPTIILLVGLVMFATAFATTPKSGAPEQASGEATFEVRSKKEGGGKSVPGTEVHFLDRKINQFKVFGRDTTRLVELQRDCKGGIFPSDPSSVPVSPSPGDATSNDARSNQDYRIGESYLGLHVDGTDEGVCIRERTSHPFGDLKIEVQEIGYFAVTDKLAGEIAINKIVVSYNRSPSTWEELQPWVVGGIFGAAIALVLQGLVEFAL